MIKIVMLPLDERPCNYYYPAILPQADYRVALPPKEMMGGKKTPADVARLKEWLFKEITDADACVLSLDMLIYGGIVPSRLHMEDEEELLARAAAVEELRRRNKKMKLYLFQLIMRCPAYSSNDEEPDYYGDYGWELHLYGRYTHLKKVNKITKEQEDDFKRLKDTIPPDVLQDFLQRREKNLKVLLSDLRFIKDGIADFFLIPQDDSAEFGFTAMDQVTVRNFLKEYSLAGKTAMYPSADEAGLTLIARAVAGSHGTRPKIYVHYASSKGGSVIPCYEDRPVDETIKYHIFTAGGRRVYSLPEADIVLAVNIGSYMYDGSDFLSLENRPTRETAYDLERNLSEFVSFLRYALEENKIVAVGDVAYANMGDIELVKLLYAEDLMLKIHSYAGWNTSSNTLGTAICQSVLRLCGKDERGNLYFLLHRYYEDVGYMAYARKKVTDEVLPSLGLDYFRADGKRGKTAAAVRREIDLFMTENFPRVAQKVTDFTAEMPWERMFEVDLRLKIQEEERSS